MTDPDTIITTMAQQREQERAQDEAHYKLRKACQARAVEMHTLLWTIANRCSVPNESLMTEIDNLLWEIHNATQ